MVSQSSVDVNHIALDYVANGKYENNEDGTIKVHYLKGQEE